MQLKKINELRKKIENILEDNKAVEIKTIDLKDKTQIADFMIIARIERIVKRFFYFLDTLCYILECSLINDLT